MIPRPSRCLLALTAVVAAGLAAPVGSALGVPPGGPRTSHNGATAKLHNKSAKPGGSIRVSGSRFPAGNQVTIKLDDRTILAVLRINSKGRFRGNVRIPGNVLKIARPGRHWFRFLAPASRSQSNTSLRRTFTLRR